MRVSIAKPLILSMPKKKYPRKKTTRFRRADNGQYTTERYAKKHPKTTIKEKR